MTWVIAFVFETDYRQNTNSYRNAHIGVARLYGGHEYMVYINIWSSNPQKKLYFKLFIDTLARIFSHYNVDRFPKV